MSNVPEGAQISDDGQWWWDGNDWQQILDSVDDTLPPDDGISSGDEPQAEPEAIFDFDVGGIRIDAEDSPVPSAGEELKVAFGYCNVGNADGAPTLILRIDDVDQDIDWDAPWCEAQTCRPPDGDGYVHGIAPLDEGDHFFEAWLEPGGENSYTSNNIHIGSA